ncbi:hypothetical protein ABDB91_12975 [Desulfoscipio sp. XC116]|uniref:hypothetical protein n=1 Tax=Desulfoscipio sp. XC116 TaxID=3144975 RepID=UPI00325AF520
MKKVSLISLVFVLCLTLGSFAYASVDNLPTTTNEIVKYNSTIHETSDPELTMKAEMQNVKSIKNMEALEENKLRELFNINEVSSTIMATPVTVAIGTDKTLTTANDGDSDTSKSGTSASYHRYTISSRSAEANSWASIWGAADAYAYVGQTFKTTGTTSKSAKIIFSGTYRGDMVGGINGNAYAEIKVKLWDSTDSVWLGTQTVASASSSNNLSKTLNGNINHAITATLEPNHVYFPYIHVSTAASEYGAHISNSDFYGDSTHRM